MVKYIKLSWVIFLLTFCQATISCNCHKGSNHKIMREAQDFVVYFYSLVFAVDHETHSSQAVLIPHLDKNLRTQYNKVLQTRKPGKNCISFNPFTDAQDSFNGFFVERIPGQADVFRVSFFFDDTNCAANSVILKIKQHNSKWKIIDVLYPNDSFSKRLSACLQK